MSVIWADGFDHWANVAEFYGIGGYVFSGVNAGQGQTQLNGGDSARTGPRGCDVAQEAKNGTLLIARNLPARQTAGISFAMLVRSDPRAGESRGFGFQQRPLNDYYDDNAGLNVRPMPSGVLGLFLNRMARQPIAQSEQNALRIGAYNQIEMRVYCHPSQGNVEVRIDGKAVISLANIDTDPQRTGNLTGFQFGDMLARYGDASTSYIPSFDDLVYWDNLGTTSNDFLGNVRCRTLRPLADVPGAEDWTPATGDDGAAMINTLPDPNKCISAAVVGNISAFELDDVPDNTAYCESVFALVLANKTDAGACGIVPAMQSGNAADEFEEINPGTARAYYTKNIPVDPATGNYWTKAALNAARFVVTRTA